MVRRYFVTATLILLLTAILTLSLSACGNDCQAHADIDGDGLCERCGDTVSSGEEGGEVKENNDGSFDLPFDPFD